MKKLNIKTKDAYSKDEMKRYLGAITEEHREVLKVVKEGFKIINSKLDRHEEILDTHTEILGKHEKILNSHTEISNRHEKILNSHTEMIGNVMENVSALKDDMQIVKKELKKKVDYDEYHSVV